MVSGGCWPGAGRLAAPSFETCTWACASRALYATCYRQVWYDNLPAGPVAITVTAPSLYVNTPQQPYALAVQVRVLPYHSR